MSERLQKQPVGRQATETEISESFLVRLAQVPAGVVGFALSKAVSNFFEAAAFNRAEKVLANPSAYSPEVVSRVAEGFAGSYLPDSEPATWAGRVLVGALVIDRLFFGWGDVKSETKLTAAGKVFWTFLAGGSLALAPYVIQKALDPRTSDYVTTPQWAILGIAAFEIGGIVIRSGVVSLARSRLEQRRTKPTVEVQTPTLQPLQPEVSKDDKQVVRKGLIIALRQKEEQLQRMIASGSNLKYPEYFKKVKEEVETLQRAIKEI